jgi:hypothetical protein
MWKENSQDALKLVGIFGVVAKICNNNNVGDVYNIHAKFLSILQE